LHVYNYWEDAIGVALAKEAIEIELDIVYDLD
jgi:hypothetical protein